MVNSLDVPKVEDEKPDALFGLVELSLHLLGNLFRQQVRLLEELRLKEVEPQAVEDSLFEVGGLDEFVLVHLDFNTLLLQKQGG